MTEGDKERLVRFYLTYDPKRATDAATLETTLRKYGRSPSTLAKMWIGLEKKYGPERATNAATKYDGMEPPEISESVSGQQKLADLDDLEASWVEESDSEVRGNSPLRRSLGSSVHSVIPAPLVSKSELRVKYLKEFGLDADDNAPPQQRQVNDGTHGKENLPHYTESDLLFPAEEDDCVATHHDKQRLIRFYNHYCGVGVKTEEDVYATLHSYGGSRTLLNRFWAAMVAKYGPEPNPQPWKKRDPQILGEATTNFIPQFYVEDRVQADEPNGSSLSDPKFRQDFLRLTKFFGKYCDKQHRKGPQEIAAVLQLYYDKNKIDKMWSDISQRYGEVPAKLRNRKFSDEDVVAVDIPTWDRLAVSGKDAEGDYFKLFERQRSDPDRSFGVPKNMTDISLKNMATPSASQPSHQPSALEYGPTVSSEETHSPPTKRREESKGSLRFPHHETYHFETCQLSVTYELSLRIYGGDFSFYERAPERKKSNFRKALAEDLCLNLEIPLTAVDVVRVYSGSIIVDALLKFTPLNNSPESARLAQSAVRLLADKLARSVNEHRFSATHMYSSYQRDLDGDESHVPFIQSVSFNPVGKSQQTNTETKPFGTYKPNRCVDPTEAMIYDAIGSGGRRIATAKDCPHFHNGTILSPFDFFKPSTRSTQENSGSCERKQQDEAETTTSFSPRSPSYPLELLGAHYAPSKTIPLRTTQTQGSVPDEKHHSPFLAKLWAQEANPPVTQSPQTIETHLQKRVAQAVAQGRRVYLPTK